MADKVIVDGDKTAGKPTEAKVESSDLSVSNQSSTNSVTENFANRLASINKQMEGSGLMPAMNQSDVPETVAKAAMLVNGQDIGNPSDRGLSSGSSVSTLLKASGADINPTMNIADLHKQLADKGWTDTPLEVNPDKSLKPGQLKPGDVVFTNMDFKGQSADPDGKVQNDFVPASPTHGRNVGIVGQDGLIYSHNFRTHNFQGRSNWSSPGPFITAMRPPQDK